MRMKNPSNEVWDNYWMNVYNRTERKIAWIFFLAGALILVAFGAYNFVEEFLIKDDTEYALIRNYPNPFNPTTTIKYSIKETERVTLKAYNTLGKEVTSLVNELKAPGEYTATFDASTLSGGIYFYTMQAGEYVATNKLLLLT
jgi:hypothetical protein